MDTNRAVSLVKKTVKILVIAVLAAVIFVSGFELWKISAVYISEAKTKGSLAQYRPGGAYNGAPAGSLPAPGNDAENSASGNNSADINNAGKSVHADTDSHRYVKVIVNQSIVDMRNEVNRAAVGWLTIPETRIDYPFVLGADNSYYLGRDIYGNDAVAGTLFMDCRCSADFTDFNTIIYGHNMKNNSMFGDLSHFADTWFFENNRYGTIYLDDGTYTLEIFAYMVVSAEDKVIYNPAVDRTGLYEYAEKYARNYRTPDLSANVVTLSTCGYEFSGARIVLLANIT